MNQPIPKVSDKDVKRIIIREFGISQLSQVMSVLQEYGKNDRVKNSNARVHLAILKIANRELNLIEEYTKIAIQDYRDVIAMAENPRWTEEIGFDEVDRAIEREVIKEDWKQYNKWLKSK